MHRKIVPPVPNLGDASLVNNKGPESEQMNKILMYALQQVDRDLFMKLRDGVLSL